MSIIVLSAYDDFSYVRQAFLLGVKDYLLKPFDRIEFTRVLDRLNEKAENQQNYSDARGRIVERVKHIVKENLGASLSLSSLSDAVSLYPQYLSSVFKEITGENLFSYVVTRKRVEKAQTLLENSNLKVYEISEICGYTDTKYVIH